jgi:hypothetical protein
MRDVIIFQTPLEFFLIFFFKSKSSEEFMVDKKVRVDECVLKKK